MEEEIFSILQRAQRELDALRLRATQGAGAHQQEIIDALKTQIQERDERIAELEWEWWRLAAMTDPFEVPHWYGSYQWSVVDADGYREYHRDCPKIQLEGGGWFSDCSWCDMTWHMNMTGKDWRNSLRARPKAQNSSE
jgi:hypothetical protein